MSGMDEEEKIVAAAGGILWRQGVNGPELAIIHRSRYNDWTLPKGKLQPGESWIECAKREVREETGFDTQVGEPAGCVCYEVQDVLKVVRFWNMRPIGGPHGRDSTEVDSIVWITPQQATKKLHYEGERMLLPSMTSSKVYVSWRKKIRLWLLRRYGPLGYRRLEATLAESRWEVQELGASSPKDELSSRLDHVQRVLEEGNVDQAWQLYAHVRRQIVEAYNDKQRERLAQDLQREAREKVSSQWRRSSIYDILGTPPQLNLPVTSDALRRAMKLRDEHFQNVYYKMGNLRHQLSFLSSSMVLILGLLVILAYKGGLTGPADWQHLVVIMLIGALGASVSAMMSLSGKSTGKRIPEQLSTAAITLTRPVLGAAAAVAAYSFLQAGIISVKPAGGFEYLVVAFAAGFSERLILRAVGKVPGGDETKS